MSSIDWNQAIRYARLVNIAYSVLPAAEYTAETIAAIEQQGYTFLQTLYGNELATDIDPHAGETVTYGFLAVSNARELVAILRGTATVLEWVQDAAFLMVPNPVHSGAGFTEDGFTAIYRSLRVGRDPNATTAVGSVGAYVHAGQAASVTVSGHSLGGSLATILTLDVALNTECRTPTVYTFASPRTGDHFFAGAFNSVVPLSYRVFNRFDLVPNLPPILPLPYEHTKTPFELLEPPGAIQQTVLCAHHLDTYIWLMGQLVGGNPYPVDPDCRGKCYPGPV
jgi:hypothetical protein